MIEMHDDRVLLCLFALVGILGFGVPALYFQQILTKFQSGWIPSPVCNVTQFMPDARRLSRPARALLRRRAGAGFRNGRRMHLH